MITLKTFLSDAPKKFVSHVYKKHSTFKGVVQGKEVVNKTLDWALDEDRINALLNELDETEKVLLLMIYTAERRGLLESDMYSLNEHMDPDNISDILHQFEDELLICCHKGDFYSFHGFQDFFELIAPRLIEETTPKTPLGDTWLSNHTHFVAHILYFLAQIQLGKIKSTQKGEFHRRSVSNVLEKLTYSEALSSEASLLELDLNFQFLVDHKFILDYEGGLILSPAGKEFLQQTQLEIHQLFFYWWSQKRLCGSQGTLHSLQLSHPQGILIEHFIRLLQPFSPGSYNSIQIYAESHDNLDTSDTQSAKGSTGYTWDELPSAIRELWVLGAIGFAQKGGRITGVQINPILKELTNFKPKQAKPLKSLPPEPLEKIFCLPNFEILLPASTSPDSRFYIECFAEKMNDENMTTYRFSKDTVVKGLQSGVGIQALQDCLTLLEFDSTNNQTILEWASTYESSEFKEVLILKVKDEAHFSALQRIPLFLELTTETIPNYGFIVPLKNKPRIKEFLNQFGLTPADPSQTIHPRMASPLKQEYVKLFSSYFPKGDIIYSLESKNRYFYKHKLNVKKPVNAPKLPTQSEMLRTLEFAILTEKIIELSYMTDSIKRILVRPLHLMRDNIPISLIGVEVQTGIRGEYKINQVSTMRIIE